MSKIKALFLDIGGVLLTNGWDRRMRAKAIEHFHLDPDEIKERHAMAFDLYEMGKISLDEYLDLVVFYQKRDFSKEQFKEFMYAQSQPYPEMLELVREMKQRYHLKLVAVNNEGRELNDYRVKNFLYDLIDFFICSSYVHLRKPDPAIFKMALDLTQLKPQEVIYIDDRPISAEAVKKFGMHGLHHTDFESTKRQLNTLLG